VRFDNPPSNPAPSKSGSIANRARAISAASSRGADVEDAPAGDETAPGARGAAIIDRVLGGTEWRRTDRAPTVYGAGADTHALMIMLRARRAAATDASDVDPTHIRGAVREDARACEQLSLPVRRSCEGASDTVKAREWRERVRRAGAAWRAEHGGGEMAEGEAGSSAAERGDGARCTADGGGGEAGFGGGEARLRA
jgi:hypothetical protein